jgi:mannan endo-1,4-beta-mannosidase
MRIKQYLKTNRLKVYGLTFFLLCLSQTSWAGFSVSGTQLLDGNGNPFVIRGINHAHTWYTSYTTQAIEDIASVNANTVRIVLSNGERWTRNSAEDVGAIIKQLKQHQMIAVLEVHDTTGYGEESAAVSLDDAVDYWLDIADVLKGEEDYVIINIGNEPFGNYVDASDWIDDHVNAIQRLREGGLTHTLMVDAPSWGQDWEQVMLENAATVAAADTLHNTIFSVHMYGVYTESSKVESYITDFLANNQVPLVIGEFAADDPSSGEAIAADTIMQIAQEQGLGYMGWSWSGNSGATYSKLIDMTLDFDLDNLTDWGERLINGENGLRDTAQPATVFSDDGGDSTGTVDALSCTVKASSVWDDGYQLSVTVANNTESDVDSWQVTLSYQEAPEIVNVWNAELNTDGLTVTANNLSWNGSLAVGDSASFGIQGDHDGSFVVPTCQ